MAPRGGACACVANGGLAAACLTPASVSLVSPGTEIFQCFLSAREAARSRERERASSGAGPGPPSGPRGAEDEPPQSQEDRRDGSGLPEGQDLYTAACNSVIHRCALLVLGVSPVQGDLLKQQQQDEGPAQPAGGGAQEGGGFMTR